ncbi:tetratricopeptide repeat protein [Dokdonella sp.]|uniref:tetratricopeptide repeat protein n=1 Tax=Dokdonella sp. TaxID=2291710 RepID=UPI002639445A|nr:tetratricopeptide repeat protein [Dokdonella sp.]
MPLIGLSLVLTILCAVHVVRSGRPLYWIWLLLIGSYLAVGIYFFVAILPDLRNDPRSRKAASQVLASIDPERQRRRIRERLELADTTDNRRALAEECRRLGDYRNAADLYQSILKGVYATDPPFMLGLAQSQAGYGDFAAARETLEALIRANPAFRSTDGHLLYARCLEELGEHDAALAEYEVLARSYPGEEARLRYAGLLRRRARPGEARTVLEDMLRRARAAPRYYRSKEREWLDAAKRELAALDGT